MENSSVQRIFNQAGVAQARWPRELLKDIKCPTVIMHGRQDRNVPLPHAYALNQKIEDSKLVIYEDIAHEMPRQNWKSAIFVRRASLLTIARPGFTQHLALLMKPC